MEAAKSNARSTLMQPRMLRIIFIVGRDRLFAGYFLKMTKAMRQPDVLCDQQRERQKSSPEKTRRRAHLKHTLQAAMLRGIPQGEE